MWLYNFGLTCYVWIIRLVAPRHPKARLWINGRKDLYKRTKARNEAGLSGNR